MSKIGTVNIQNCKIGAGVVSKILIGTDVYWSNVPKAMPPFDLNDWYIIGGTTTGTYGLTIQNNKLVQSLTAWTTNWNNCTITSNELRTARHIAINHTINSNRGTFSGTVRFIVEAKIGNTWTEVARANGSTAPGTRTITIDVNTTATRMRIKSFLEGYMGEGAYGENLNCSIVFNSINFS